MTDIPTPILPQQSGATDAIRGSGFGLPKDLLEKARGRVALFALVIVIAGVVALAITVPLWRALGVERQLFTRLVQVGMVALSAALYLVARHTRLNHTVVLHLGLAYEITICSTAVCR